MKRAARCIRRLFPLPVAAGILALLLVSTACGNNDPGAAPPADAEGESSDPGEAAPVIWPGRIFSIDDVVAATSPGGMGGPGGPPGDMPDMDDM